jgi:hypothetical protein
MIGYCSIAVVVFAVPGYLRGFCWDDVVTVQAVLNGCSRDGIYLKVAN